MKLTSHMRAALQRARCGPLRRTTGPDGHTGAWPAPPATLHALERHRLLNRAETRNRHGRPMTTWTITQPGRQALEPTVRERADGIRYLTDRNRHPERDDYTTDPRFAIKGEPEAVEPSAITPISVVRHMQARREDHLRREARALAQRTREAVVYAQRQGLRDELDQLRQSLAAIDAKRRAA